MSEATVITLKNDLSELERVGTVVNGFGKRHGLPDKVVFELGLALDEVLTNVVSYAYDGGEHEITIRLSLGSAAVTVEVEDDGRPFDPLQVAAPDLDRRLEDRAVGGLGLHLVRKVMDSLAYHRRGGKNLLIMCKRVAPV